MVWYGGDGLMVVGSEDGLVWYSDLVVCSGADPVDCCGVLVWCGDLLWRSVRKMVWSEY